MQPQLSLAVRWHAKVGLAAGVLRGPWWRKARGCWYQLFGISIWNIYGNVFTPNPKTLLSGQMSNPGHCHLQLTVQVFFVTWKFHVIFHWYSIEKHTPYIYIWDIYILKLYHIISHESWFLVEFPAVCSLFSYPCLFSSTSLDPCGEGSWNT